MVRLPAKPPPLPSKAVHIRRFGELGGGPRVYVFVDVLDELMFQAGYRPGEQGGALLVGGAYEGPAGQYVEIQGFTEASWLGDISAWHRQLQREYRDTLVSLREEDPTRWILGWSWGQRGSRGLMTPEAARIHLSFFNLAFQVYVSLDPESRDVGFYHFDDGSFHNIGFNAVSHLQSDEIVSDPDAKPANADAAETTPEVEVDDEPELEPQPDDNQPQPDDNQPQPDDNQPQPDDNQPQPGTDEPVPGADARRTTEPDDEPDIGLLRPLPSLSELNRRTVTRAPTSASTSRTESASRQTGGWTIREITNQDAEALFGDDLEDDLWDAFDEIETQVGASATDAPIEGRVVATKEDWLEWTGADRPLLDDRHTTAEPPDDPPEDDDSQASRASAMDLRARFALLREQRKKREARRRPESEGLNDEDNTNNPTSRDD